MSAEEEEEEEEVDMHEESEGGEEEYEYEDDQGFGSEEEELQYPEDQEGEDEEEYRYEAGDGAAELSQESPVARTSHVSMTAQELKKVQLQMIERVADDLGFSKAHTSTLLRHCGWDESLLQAKFQQDLDLLFSAAGTQLSTGLSSDGGTASSSDLSVQCLVCFDQVTFDDSGALQCGHRFCNECWTAMLENAVKTGGPGGQSCLETTCMQNGCAIVVGEDMFETYCAPDVYQAYEHVRLLSFVDDNDKYVWCPGVNCQQVVASPHQRNVVCSEGHHFCFGCKGAAHAPVSCLEYNAWTEKIEQKKGPDGKMTKLNDVKCCPNPKCKVPTTKVSGCMYLTCTKCHCHWCWQCGDWGSIDNRPAPHHVFDCNTPPNKDWLGQTSSLFDNDGRFMFYLERSENHFAAERFAEDLRRNAKEMRDNLLCNSAGAEDLGVDFDQLVAATETLIHCRRVLRWAYAWAFFEADAGLRQLFEFSQKDLETMTEKLSSITENRTVNELLKEFSEIVEYNAVLRKYLDAMEFYVRHGGERPPPGENKDQSADADAAAAAAAAGGGGGGGGDGSEQNNEELGTNQDQERPPAGNAGSRGDGGIKRGRRGRANKKAKPAPAVKGKAPKGKAKR